MAAIMSLPHQLNSPWAAFASSGSGFNVIQPPHISNPFHNIGAPLSPPITPTFSASATSSTLPLPLPTSLPSAHTQPWLNSSHPFGSSQPSLTTPSFSSPSPFNTLPSAPSPFTQHPSPFASAPAAYSSPSPSLFPNVPSHSFSSPAPAASFGSPSVSAFPSCFSTSSPASTLPLPASPSGFPAQVKQQQPQLAPSVLSRKRAFTQTETEPQPSAVPIASPTPFSSSPFTQSSFGSSSSAPAPVSAPLGKRTLTQASAVNDDDSSAVRTVGKRTKTRLESAVEALSGCVPTETDDEEDDRILKRVRKPSSFNTTLIDEYKEGERLFEPIVDTIPESIRQPLRIPREMALIPSRSIRFKSNIIPLRPDDREAWFGDNPSLSPFSSAFPTHSPAFFAPITPDTCFCLLNTEGRILEADSKLIRLLKISDASSLTGTSLLTFFHRDEWHKAQGTVARLMHNLSKVEDNQSFVTQSFSHRMHDSVGNRFSICGRLYAFRFKGEPLIVCKLVPLGSEADRALIDSATARVWNSASCPSSSPSSLSTAVQEFESDVPPRPSSVFISEMAAGEYHHPSALSTSVPRIVTVDEEEHEALESDDVNMS